MPKPRASNQMPNDMPVAEELTHTGSKHPVQFLDEQTRIEQCQQVIRLIEGGLSERAACKSVGIARSTFRQAINKVNMGDHYSRALAALAHFQVGRIEEVIEDAENGTLDPAAARVVIDGRKWIASKLLPKQYGDKVINELVGADGGAVKVEQVNPLEMIEARLAKLIAARPDETK